MTTSCQHEPCCPAASAVDHDRARTIAAFHEQGWSLLCNGVILFDDTGELLPDGSVISPHRARAPHGFGHPRFSVGVPLSAKTTTLGAFIPEFVGTMEVLR